MPLSPVVVILTKPLQVIFANVLINVGCKSRSFCSQAFHLGNVFFSGTFIGIEVNRSIPEFYADAIRNDLIGDNAGVFAD